MNRYLVLTNDYSEEMIRGYERAAPEAQFVHLALSYQMGPGRAREYFRLGKALTPVGTLMVGNRLSHRFPPKALTELLNEWPKEHSILIGLHAESRPSVTVDNVSGPSAMVAHLVQIHGRSSFAVVAGPTLSQNNQLRLSAVRESLTRHGQTLPEHRVLWSDFTMENARSQFAEWWQAGNRADAVVCMNDDMALGVLDFLKSAGIEVGRDVSVTGFDNMPRGHRSSPALTTVDESPTTLALRAMSHLQSTPERTSANPTSYPLVIRQSCGCDRHEWKSLFFGADREENFRSLMSELNRHFEDLDRSRLHLTHLRRLAPEVIASFDKGHLEEIFHSWFLRLGVRWAKLAEYAPGPEGNLTHVTDDGGTLSDRRSWGLEWDGKGFTQLGIGTMRTFLDSLPTDLPGTILVWPITSSGHIHGLFAAHVPPGLGHLLENMGSLAAGVLAGARLIEKREEAEHLLRQALRLLESHNLELSEKANRDELTGLQNRRGFLQSVSRDLSLPLPMDMERVILFLDLDGLKPINDTHGHAAGDEAIRGFADVLRDVFRANDVLARLGGDEFVILARRRHGDTVEKIRERISRRVLQFNESLNRPWSLSFSMGMSNPISPHTDLDEVLAQADGLLYEEKRLKKGRVKPPPTGA